MCCQVGWQGVSLVAPAKGLLLGPSSFGHMLGGS